MERIFFDVSHSRIDEVSFEEKGRSFHFSVKRDDLIDELVSGNKWRKLRLYVEQALHKGAIGLVTFGGAYSNHLVATAKACHILGLKSVGFVRGEELHASSNATLAQCADFGMELVFVDRETYRQKDDWDYLTGIKHGFPGHVVVPEGGKGFYGMLGCQDILRETPNEYSDVFIAAGTGTTAAGVILSAPTNTKVHVVSALKGAFMRESVMNELKNVLTDEELMEDFLSRAVFHEEFHFGGYGKTTSELFEFMQEFTRQTGVPLDKVYTAKAAFALLSFLRSNDDLNGKPLFIHTGGLQGN